MILVFEMIWTGTMHAPGNSATIQTILAACPEQAVRVHAEGTHLANLRADPLLAAHGNLDFVEIAISPRHRYRTHLVSWRRFLTEFATLWRGVQSTPRDERCLIFLISATPTAILAARLVARLDRRVVGVQVGMHGNLNDLTAWRSRNPMRRWFDLPSVMGRRQSPKVRYLVLEEGIRRELARIAPGAAEVTDVLALPINVAEVPAVPETRLALPLRIGLVGQATEEKGITPFLETARVFKARHGDKVEFTLIGRAIKGTDLSRFDVLDDPVSTDHLSRQAFLERLAGLHYVFLPLSARYYSLSASGALIDAITWLKPVIASDLPIVADQFKRFGDIGYLCEDLAGMQAALEAVLIDMDRERYARQREALRQARAARMPDALARDYARILADRFPELQADRSDSH